MVIVIDVGMFLFSFKICSSMYCQLLYVVGISMSNKTSVVAFVFDVY